MPRSAAVTRMFVALFVMGLLFPVVFWGSRKSLETMFTSPVQWVPEDFEERQRFEQFIQHFETNDALVLSWKGCTIDDPRLDRLHEALLNNPDPEVAKLCDAYYQRVLSGYRSVRDLMDEPLEMSRDEAVERLESTLVGSDGETSCMIAILSRRGGDERVAPIELYLQIAEEVVGIPQEEFHLVGPPVDAATIDTHSVASLRTFAVPSALLVFFLCRVCLKSWRFTLIVFLTALFGQTLTLALVYYSGATMNAVLIVMPPLAMVLTVSGGVHLVNYYHDEVSLHGPDGAAKRAIANGAAPCLLAAATTVIGLLSLLVSDVVPIKMFGVFSAIAICTTISLLFLLLPGAMERWPVVLPKKVGSGRFDFSDRLGDFVCRYRLPIGIGTILLMLGAGYGLVWMRTSVNVRSLFTEGSRILTDYRWIETNVGPMVPVEVVVNFEQDCPLDELQRLRVVRDVQQHVNDVEAVGGSLSAATFFPEIPEGSGGRARARFVALRRQLEERHDRFKEMHYLYETPEVQSWRISGRVPALSSLDYGEFLKELETHVDPVLADLKAQPGMEATTTTFTGVMPLAYDTQRALLNDLFNSFLTALALVTLVMILVMRSIVAGLVSMIPNMFPTLVLFGVTSWRGVPIDIGSVMTASVALGIAVDDTLHFLTWYRREYDASGDTSQAVRTAFRHCARAMAQTTIICSIGLCIYTLSDFVPTRRFSWMMLTLLLAALVGDLLQLPALLAGPIGRWFPRRAPQEQKELQRPPRNIVALADAASVEKATS